MREVRAWLLRLGGLFTRKPSEVDLAAEIESHLQLHIDENLRAGMTPEAARREALLKLGGVEQTKEACRERRGLPWLEATWQDLSFGARMLRKHPGFTAVAVLTLALGIGANSAVFSIVNAVMLRPLPYQDSQRLVSVSSKTGMFPDMTLNVTWPAFQAMRNQVTSFERSAAYRTQSKALTGRGDPQLLEVAAVSDGFFEELGTRAKIGRLLGDSDQGGETGAVIVLSDALWRARFGADAKIVGRTITLDHELYSVVGVTQEGFSFPENADVWIPLVVKADSKENPLFFAFGFLGKLSRTAGVKQLQAELKTVSSKLQKQYPQLKDGYDLVPTRLMDEEVSDARAAFYVLLGAATLVLLIACTNLASMLFSRGWARQQEIAVRAALGASKGRIFRQLLAESCLLGLLGGIVGIAFAAAGVKVFLVVAPEDTPRMAEIQPDWTMVGFALVSALLTGMLFGVAPARGSMRAAVHGALKEGAGRMGGLSLRQSRAGSVLVAGEIALAFVLLLGAGLMLQTLGRLLRQNPGFRTDHLLTFELYQSALQSEADRKKDAPAEVARTRDIVEQVRALPGVEQAAAASYGLLGGMIGVHGGLRVEGSTVVDQNASFAVRARAVSPGYFETLGIRLVKGRAFTEADGLNSAPVAIVNEQMARKFWGTLEVLGKRFTSDSDENGKPPWAEIVGVVTDARESLVRDEPVAEFYAPLYQGLAGGATLLVRSAGKPERLANTVTNTIWRAYPDLPVTHVMTMEAVIEKSVGNERLHTALLAAFAMTGLLMALAGTYGVIAYAVERRTQEIGIRMALGAGRTDVLALVGKQALLPVVAGLAIGIPVALVAERAIRSELYGVRATDPATYLAAALLMLLVAAVACLVPARRAMRVDPMVALRYE
jgi:putative ABC transport system permease protein